jgi:hypothetical protein
MHHIQRRIRNLFSCLTGLFYSEQTRFFKVVAVLEKYAIPTKTLNRGFTPATVCSSEKCDNSPTGATS